MGKLYLVPTPVGNLEDMTFRAIRVLKEVDLVLAEDTRTSSMLFRKFEIRTPMASHHKFNEHKTSASIAEKIAAGMNVEEHIRGQFAIACHNGPHQRKMTCN